MDYWEKVDYFWLDDFKRYILIFSSKSCIFFYYIQEIGQFKVLCFYYMEWVYLLLYLIKFMLNGIGELCYCYYIYSLQRGDLFFIDCWDY